MFVSSRTGWHQQALCFLSINCRGTMTSVHIQCAPQVLGCGFLPLCFCGFACRCQYLTVQCSCRCSHCMLDSPGARRCTTAVRNMVHVVHVYDTGMTWCVVINTSMAAHCVIYLSLKQVAR